MWQLDACVVSLSRGDGPVAVGKLQSEAQTVVDQPLSVLSAEQACAINALVRAGGRLQGAQRISLLADGSCAIAGERCDGSDSFDSVSSASGDEAPSAHSVKRRSAAASSSKRALGDLYLRSFMFSVDDESLLERSQSGGSNSSHSDLALHIIAVTRTREAIDECEFDHPFVDDKQ